MIILLNHQIESLPNEPEMAPSMEKVMKYDTSLMEDVDTEPSLFAEERR